MASFSKFQGATAPKTGSNRKFGGSPKPTVSEPKKPVRALYGFPGRSDVNAVCGSEGAGVDIVSKSKVISQLSLRATFDSKTHPR